MYDEDTYEKGLITGQLIQAESKLSSDELRLKHAQIDVKFSKECVKRLESELEKLDNPDSELIEKLDQMLCNYPEYSTDWIRAEHWPLDEESEEVRYSYVEFSVQNPDDEEEREIHKISGKDLVETYKRYGAELEKSYEESCEFFDMEMVDVFMQYHFYGSIVYG